MDNWIPHTGWLCLRDTSGKLIRIAVGTWRNIYHHYLTFIIYAIVIIAIRVESYTTRLEELPRPLQYHTGQLRAFASKTSLVHVHWDFIEALIQAV